MDSIENEYTRNSVFYEEYLLDFSCMFDCVCKATSVFVLTKTWRAPAFTCINILFYISTDNIIETLGF